MDGMRPFFDNNSQIRSNVTLVSAHTSSITAEGAGESDELPDEVIGFKIAKILLYVFILVSSTLGNFLVVSVICRSARMRTNASNILILNLALCDLLTPLISIPFDLVVQEASYTWPFGRAMCKFLAPLATFTSTSSSLTLGCIAFDRYRALLHPFKTKLSILQIKYMIVALHGFSLAVVVPYMVFLDTGDGTTCSEYWPDFAYRKAYTIVLFLSQYALPLLFMLCIYVLAATKMFKSSTKLRNILVPDKKRHKMTINLRESFTMRRESNKKLSKMFATVVAVFAICTFPNEVFWLWSDFAGGHKSENAFYGAIICHWFTYANSCLNPLIFYLYNKDFNHGFRSILRCIVCKKEKDIERLHRVWQDIKLDRDILSPKSRKAEHKSST